MRTLTTIRAPSGRQYCIAIVTKVYKRCVNSGMYADQSCKLRLLKSENEQFTNHRFDARDRYRHLTYLKQNRRTRHCQIDFGGFYSEIIRYCECNACRPCTKKTGGQQPSVAYRLLNCNEQMSLFVLPQATHCKRTATY